MGPPKGWSPGMCEKYTLEETTEKWKEMIADRPWYENDKGFWIEPGTRSWPDQKDLWYLKCYDEGTGYIVCCYYSFFRKTGDINIPPEAGWRKFGWRETWYSKAPAPMIRVVNP